MSIIREENDQVVGTILSLATTIMGKVKVGEVGIDPDKVDTNIHQVASAILNAYYSNKLKSGKTNLKGLIVPTPDSWLNMLPYHKNNSNMATFGLSVADNSATEQLAKRLLSEINMYRAKYTYKAKCYATKVNNYSKSLNTTTPIEDMFDVRSLTIVPTFKLLVDKGWLDAPIIDNDVNEDKFIDLSNISLDLDVIDSDLEIGLLIKDDFKGMRNITEMTSVINSILTKTTIHKVRSILSNYDIGDINMMVLLLVQMTNHFKKLNVGSQEYNHISGILRVIITKLRFVKQRYDNLVGLNTVVVGSKHTDESTIIYVLADTFNKYMADGGSLKAIIGGSYKLGNMTLNSVTKPTEGGFRRFVITASMLDIEKDDYVTVRRHMQDAIILENKNNTVQRLRNYYIFGLDGILDSEEMAVHSEIQTYITNSSIGKLSKIEETTLDIIANIVAKDTNFPLFITAVNDAKIILGERDDMDGYINYGILTVLCHFLAGQTTLK